MLIMTFFDSRYFHGLFDGSVDRCFFQYHLCFCLSNSWPLWTNERDKQMTICNLKILNRCHLIESLKVIYKLIFLIASEYQLFNVLEEKKFAIDGSFSDIRRCLRWSSKPFRWNQLAIAHITSTWITIMLASLNVFFLFSVVFN